MRDVIAVRRNGGTHSRGQLSALARAAANGAVPDHQLAAWLMAAYLNPLTVQETAWLTQAMADSGERVDRSGLPKPWVDKHSTGGVGDKTTLVLLPLLAACGVPALKMSGRGLGITGGTVDKMESIPGFRAELSPAEVLDQAKRIGIAWSGQTARLAPADKVLYALRDAIGAVDSVPLIASSILCKKLASGAEIVVLDVKCGRGAFMKSLDAAKELAHWLEEVGTLAGLSTRAVITDMDQPLGRTAGNAIEVREAVDVLSGEPGPVRDLCVFLAEHTLRTAGLDPALVQKALDSGRALAKFHEWLLAQGAAPDALERLPQAALRVEVVSARAGWVSSVDAGAVGSAVIALGGGRSQPGGPIDPAVGIETWRRVGDPVSVGEKVFTVHASKQPDQWLLASLENAVTVSPTIVSARPLVLVNR